MRRFQDFLKKREDGFDLNFGTANHQSSLPQYNSLKDVNMKHYFENKEVQQLLRRTGQIDESGNVIDLKRNEYKLQIIEKEFQRICRSEDKLEKAQEEARGRLQFKRAHENIQNLRRQKYAKQAKATTKNETNKSS